jgi:hypothetical protein
MRRPQPRDPGNESALSHTCQLIIQVEKKYMIWIFFNKIFLQTYWRFQKQSAQSVNIITEIVDFVENLVDIGISSVTIEIVLQAMQTLIELVQGPCKENQELLVHSNLPGLCMYLLEHNDYPGKFCNH